MEINPTVWDFTISPFGTLEGKINITLLQENKLVITKIKTPPAKNTSNKKQAS